MRSVILTLNGVTLSFAPLTPAAAGTYTHTANLSPGRAFEVLAGGRLRPAAGAAGGREFYGRGRVTGAGAPVPFWLLRDPGGYVVFITPPAGAAG